MSDEHRILIQRAFVPHVAVLADEPTEAMIRAKGLPGGLLQLLRPFGEAVPGKITIRDSVGASKSHDDFGIRFVDPADGLGLPNMSGRPSLQVDTANGQRDGGETVVELYPPETGRWARSADRGAGGLSLAVLRV